MFYELQNVKGTRVITFDKMLVIYIKTIAKLLRVKQRALPNPNAELWTPWDGMITMPSF